MADIANLKVGSSVYSIKDSTARTTANNADVKADQAINDSAVAQAKATEAKNSAATANTSANNANTKIDNSKIIGTYTENTQTLEVSLEIGTVS